MMDMTRRLLLFCAFAGTWLTYSQAEEKHRRDNKSHCFGTNNGVSSAQGGDRYTQYQQAYAGCQVVIGNLEIVRLTNLTVDYDLSFLSDIEEVTGYVLIFTVYARVIPLTSLRLIRGQKTYTPEAQPDKKFALFISWNHHHNNNKGLAEIQLKALTEISSGSVFIKNNKFLCHVDTIDWNQIISRSNAMTIVELNAQQCSPCASQCMNRCWSAMENMCQQLTRNCSPVCRDRCFGPSPHQCCDPQCSVGCTGQGDWQCLACRNFEDENRCVGSCPPLRIYNPITGENEKNPNGKYMYRSECVKKCPAHMSVELGACVANCQPGYTEGQDRSCVSCEGNCQERCNGTEDRWINEGNIREFKGCVVVKGNIRILQPTFSGSFKVDQLSALRQIREISGYLDVDADHVGFTDLSFLRDLEAIKGQQLLYNGVALRIYNSSLVSLGLNRLKEISDGSVLIKNNPNLCFVNSVNWKKMLSNTSSNVLNNRETSSCESESLICSDQCSADGCMGRGRDECLRCANFHYKGVCIESCSVYDNVTLYLPNSTRECAACHEECKTNCSGPGADQCSDCRRFQNGSVCVSACSPWQYPNERDKCVNCDAICDGGCTGPGRNLGPGGCTSCHLLLLDSDGSTAIECIPMSALGECFNYTPSYRSKENDVGHKSSATCQKCAVFTEDGLCAGRCSSRSFVNGSRCSPCHESCLTCSGPTQSDCLSCDNSKVFEKFNCSNECPEFAPQPIHEGQEGICAPKEQNNGRHLALVVGVVVAGFVFLGIIVLLILILRRQLAKTEEKKLRLTAKLTGVIECEPLTPSNAKPDMSVLRLIKESALKRRNAIGSGAFGTVYKGLWIPEDDDVKIPVAIKVLQDGSVGQSESLLEEARIMASVDHPCCVRILAVCMTAEMMLVTQLMPLGCLLDYVRKNKDQVGSKTLLNWSTQIAKGMAYLEDRGIIHRDLAARNVLVQSSHHVKITDFGLSKMVDRSDRFQQSGGKWPIKWLALESIQHQIFTHKSDVWSFGVTIWELCTYGQRPYDGISARNVVDLLEKGERLPQPSICTIDVYMIMIKCWMLDADSRPTFSDLSAEFAKMARDPGRYLVVQNDGALKLASQSVSTRDLLKFMSLDSTEAGENIISGDDYINNLNRRKSSLNLQNAKGNVFSKDETKTEATPLLRLNIPRHSAVQGPPDSGQLSPRYSPDPSSLVQSISFHRGRGENRDTSSTGASIYRLPEKQHDPSPPPPLRQATDSSDYLQPVTSPADGPAYLELEYESTEGNSILATQMKSREDEAENPLELKKRSLPPVMTVTNAEYFDETEG